MIQGKFHHLRYSDIARTCVDPSPFLTFGFLLSMGTLVANFRDHFGFRLRTSAVESASAFNAAAQSFVAWHADTMGHLDAAIEEDINFALPRILKAWILHGGRTKKFDPAINRLIADIGPPDNLASRDQALLEGLKVAHSGKFQAGAAALEAHLATHPLDLIAHRLLQFELFWCGESRWMRDVAERAAPAWNEDSPGYPHFLAVRAFSNEEAGDYGTAERAGRGAVERAPDSAWGAHAIAHVFLMQGRMGEGRAWMEGLCGNWNKANQIGHHNWWHLCLFLLEAGEHDQILELLISRIRNPESPLVQAVPDATIDLQNVTSLLMRLELRGVDVGDRWQVIADISTERTKDHANPFSSAHDAMALAAVGDFTSIDTLVASMHASGAEHGTVGHVTTAFGIPLVKAMAAHRKREYDKVIELLWPVRRGLYQVGGSHAQRDIFFQVLVDAAMHANKTVMLSVLMDDISSIGFARVPERSLYREAAALAA